MRIKAHNSFQTFITIHCAWEASQRVSRSQVSVRCLPLGKHYFRCWRHWWEQKSLLALALILVGRNRQYKANKYKIRNVEKSEAEKEDKEGDRVQFEVG